MNSAPPHHAPHAKPDWALNVVVALGIYWAANYLIPVFFHGIQSPLEWLPLLGFASPLLREPGIQWFKVSAVVLCVTEVFISAVAFVGSFIDYMDPKGFQVLILGVPVATIWGTFGQLIYLTGRSALFIFAGLVITKRCEQEMA